MNWQSVDERLIRQGELLLRHQSVSNWLDRAQKFGLVEAEVRAKGKREIRYYRLTEKGKVFAKASIDRSNPGTSKFMREDMDKYFRSSVLTY